jgi:hypothetical protein
LPPPPPHTPPAPIPQPLSRFSDFEWLNTRLSLTFPAAVIPPFPEKRLVMNTDPEFVAARQAALEVYVEKVARHPRLGTSLDLLVFLDASDPGLEAAKSYIEAAAAESEDSLLDRGVDAAKALLGGGGGGVHEAELRPDDGYLADAAAHGVAFARLEKVVRSGEAAHAAGGASAAALTELGKAMMALGETERRYGGVVAATRASVLSGVAANAAFDAAAGGGGGALAALPPAPKVDAAAAAAFNAHNAKLAAQADGSIEGMFTADFSDPYSSVAAANAPRAAPPKGGEAATITSGRLGTTLSLSGSAAATVGDVLLASGGVLLEEAALWKSQLKSFGDAFHGPLRAEGDFARGLDEALARRADAVARVVDASAQLARRKNALLGLRPGAGDYHTKVGEAQAAVEKAETAVAARRSELETMTAVLKVGAPRGTRPPPTLAAAAVVSRPPPPPPTPFNRPHRAKWTACGARATTTSPSGWQLTRWSRPPLRARARWRTPRSSASCRARAARRNGRPAKSACPRLRGAPRRR